MKIRDYLEIIVNHLNESNEGQKYQIKQLIYPIEYEHYGTDHDFLLGTNKKDSAVIGIAPEEYDEKRIYQGYLTYPEEYPNFYESKQFILCYGPDENCLNFEEIMNKDYSYCNLYGLNATIEYYIKNKIESGLSSKQILEDLKLLNDIKQADCDKILIKK